MSNHNQEGHVLYTLNFGFLKACCSYYSAMDVYRLLNLRDYGGGKAVSLQLLCKTIAWMG
jgi:hypothetical protein